MKLTKKQQKEIERLIAEITNTAKEVVEDYAKNPSEMSGSITQVAEGSKLISDKKKKDT